MKNVALRSLAIVFSAILAFSVLLPSALACLNDRESDRSEKEFKSRYDKPHDSPKVLPGAISRSSSEPQPERESVTSSRTWNIAGFSALAGGVGLMGGAIFLVSKKMAR